MLSENLVKVRKENGITQEALAIKLNVVRQTISKWEKGIAVPDADTLCKIADALDVSVSVLLGETESKDSPDLTSISNSLAQINEQLATRNRRSANVWKAISLVLLIAIGLLIGKCFLSNSNTLLLPEILEVSNINFTATSDKLICTFAPSIMFDGITYTVNIYNNNEAIPNSTVISNYADGVCSVSFDKTQLQESVDYSVVLEVNYKGVIRIVSLAESLSFNKNTVSYGPQFDS